PSAALCSGGWGWLETASQCSSKNVSYQCGSTTAPATTSIAIVVEAPSGLAAEPACLDVASQQWAGTVLVVAEPVVEHLHDRQARVEADQVGQPQWPHGVAHAQAHDRVDRVAVADALHQAVDRLVDHGHEDAVGDEAGMVVGL